VPRGQASGTGVRDTVDQAEAKVKKPPELPELPELAKLTALTGDRPAAAGGSAQSAVRSQILPPVIRLSCSKLIGTPEESVPAAGYNVS
jgi:hypothetical protein